MRDSLLRRFLRLFRSLGVGALASAVDFLGLVCLVEVLGLEAVEANVPALLLGALIQFIGCRHWVFRASTEELAPQAMGFAVVEVLTLVLNGLVFHVLLTAFSAPYALARPVGTFLVFVAFSYPSWHLVFRPTESA